SFLIPPPSTSEIYTLSLHDALPICEQFMVWVAGPSPAQVQSHAADQAGVGVGFRRVTDQACRFVDHEQLGVFVNDLEQFVHQHRSEEHTSELQSLAYLVCRLLLEKK